VFQTRWRGFDCVVKRVKDDSFSSADYKALQKKVELIKSVFILLVSPHIGLIIPLFREKVGLHPRFIYIYGVCEPPEGGIAIVMEVCQPLQPEGTKMLISLRIPPARPIL